MKRLRTFIALAAVPLFLAACGNLSSSSISGTSGTSKSSKTQLTGQSSDGDYEGVIKSGHYQTSKSRGVTNSQDSGNTYNVKSFENGMLGVSKKVFYEELRFPRRPVFKLINCSKLVGSKDQIKSNWIESEE